MSKWLANGRPFTRIVWFIAIWAGSVTALALVAFVIRLAIT